MTPSTAEGIVCTCGRRFRWRSELAGKKVRCKCGNPLKFPLADPALSPLPSTPSSNAAPKPQNIIELSESDLPPIEITEADLLPDPPPAPPPPAPTTITACPSCSFMIQPGAVLCTRCGYNLHTGTQLSTQVVQEPRVPLPRIATPAAQESAKSAFSASSFAYTLGLFGICGPLLPLDGKQFKLLIIFGPAAPLVALICGLVGAWLFLMEDCVLLASIAGAGTIIAFIYGVSHGVLSM